MRQGPNNSNNNNNRRSRGRGGNNNSNSSSGSSGSNNNAGRRQNVPLRHQNFDSNGPDVRIRGNAWQVHEKYLALARDASTSGDRVTAENYMQHADHYFRIISQIQEAENRQRGPNPNGNGHPQHANGGHESGDDQDEGDEDGEGGGNSDDRVPMNA